MSASICAFTAICEEDRCWIPQYLREVERLGVSFVVLFDRVSPETKYRMLASPRCLGHVARYVDQGEFTETAKQPLLDLISPRAFNWALAWDIDETFELDAPETILVASNSSADWVSMRWLNFWGDTRHIRVDGAWPLGRRVKMLNLSDGRRWRFDHPITNGPKLLDTSRQDRGFDSEIVCLHHGMMTQELRRMHKERWDRIYSTALRGDANPYGFWKHAIETEAEAVTVKHGY